VELAQRENNSKSLQNSGTASSLFQPVSVCFCKENLILIIGEIANYVLFKCLETKPDKGYYTCQTYQRRATKFILNDYNSSYFDRLKKLNLLPLMYIFELNEVLLQ